jgi:SAM-dependent methyltransferase
MVKAAGSVWPKILPPLTREQQAIQDDFMRYWHETLPKRYQAIECFNHGFPVRAVPAKPGGRTLEIGAGLGEHLAYEDLAGQDYTCIELREQMAQGIRGRFAGVNVVAADCQEALPFEDDYFDRVIAIHVLEHLPNLPAALGEVRRTLKSNGRFAVVIPCDPGLAYGFSRRISAQRLFEKRYKQSYSTFIKREHINSVHEVVRELRKQFTVERQRYFPLLVPVAALNLCLGLVLRRRDARRARPS